MKKQKKHFLRKRENEQRQIKRIVAQVKNELTADITVEEETGPKEPAPHGETEQLIDFLEQHYAFRFNIVMGYAEYKEKGTGGSSWQPIDKRTINSLTLQARLNGINIWNNDTWRYVESYKVDDYDPVKGYLDSVRGTWDGEDHIARLANCVKTTCKQWEQWFRRWLLAMVAQWTGLDNHYGNAVAPLLISGQGYHKSTFCRQLLPPELSWGYMDNLILSEKKQVMQAMSQMLLINLDEFNQISPTLQAGFLKNVIQLATVKMRRPYAKHVEEFPRMASFIATTNMSDVLNDPTGCRRFICIELTEPIDVDTPPCHRQLYAQILHLLDQGEHYWFDMQETQAVMEHNCQYQMKKPEESFFEDCFDITDNEAEGCYMSTTSIYEYIRQRMGSHLSEKSVINFGRSLASIEGIVRRRSKRGSEYLVIPKRR